MLVLLRSSVLLVSFLSISLFRSQKKVLLDSNLETLTFDDFLLVVKSRVLLVLEKPSF